MVEAISAAGYNAWSRGCGHRPRPGVVGVPPARRPLPGGRRPADQRRDDRAATAILVAVPGLVHRGWARRRRLGGMEALTGRLGGTTQIVGDDIFVTDPAIIAGAMPGGRQRRAHQTQPDRHVTETLEAMAMCRQAGYPQLVSHRSGETGDHFIADLAVASGCGHLKPGAPARGERVAKYNRLLEIAAAAPALRYGHARRLTSGRPRPGSGQRRSRPGRPA